MAFHMNKFQIEGQMQQFAGNIKQAVGRMIGSAPLQARGKMLCAIGRVQTYHGDRKQELQRLSNHDFNRGAI